jgi:hypothetical protein
LPVHSNGISASAVFDMQPQQNLNANSAATNFAPQCGSPMPKKCGSADPVAIAWVKGRGIHANRSIAAATGAPAPALRLLSRRQCAISSATGNFRKKRRLGFSGMTGCGLVSGCFSLGRCAECSAKEHPAAGDNHDQCAPIIFWRQ